MAPRYTVQIMVSEDTPIGEHGHRVEFKASAELATFDDLNHATHYMRDCVQAIKASEEPT